MIKTIMTAVMRLANNMIPKDRKHIVFINYKYSDNAKAFFEYIRKNNPDYRLVWLFEDDKDLNNIHLNFEKYRRKSLIGIWKFFKSRYIVTSHFDNVGIKSAQQIYVSLWHGMPLKRIGWFNEVNENDKRYSKADIIISTSQLMTCVLASCFHVDPKKVYITGQPKNDKLINNTKQRNTILKQLVSTLISSTLSPKIITYLPTFRSFGNYYDGGNQFLRELFAQANCYKLNEILNNYNAVLIVKTHYYENINDILGDVNDYPRIKFINDDYLLIKNLDLYELLSVTDVLVTDYSSVYFDFLLLNKPIIFYVPDLDEYMTRRGFVLEPFDFWTPGPKVRTVESFIDTLISTLKSPQNYDKQRRIINSLINHYQDGQSSKRIWDLMNHKTIKAL